MIMRSKWNSVPYILPLVFIMTFIAIFATNCHQIDAVGVFQIAIPSTSSAVSYTVSSFVGPLAPIITLTMTLHFNAAQNPGVDISEQLISSYFVKPTAVISNSGSGQPEITWTELIDSGSTVSYKGVLNFLHSRSSNTSMRLFFNPLLLTRFDLVVKEGADIDSQLVTFAYSFGAAPLRYPYQDTRFTPVYRLFIEPQANTVQFYFPNLPHFDANDFCIGMQFNVAFLSSFNVIQLDDEGFTQGVTPKLSFKSDDSLRAVVCFESEDSTAILGSIGFTLPGIPANLSYVNFFEISQKLIDPYLVFPSGVTHRLTFGASSVAPLQLINISEAAQLFSSQQSTTTSSWFQWSLSYNPSYNSPQGDSLTFLSEFEYFEESQIHFCRPIDKDFDKIKSISLSNDKFKILPIQPAPQSQTPITINCFGTVSPYYRHRDGIDESSTWQKNSETPFMVQSAASAFGPFSNPFDFDKSTLPAVNSLPQIIHTTENYQLLVINSAVIAQHKLVVAVNGYTLATGIVFRIPNVFSVVKARGDQTSVTDDNYVTMTYYKSGAQPTLFAGKTPPYTDIVPPTLKTGSAKCTKQNATDGSNTTIYICNPPPKIMIDLTFTMFISREVDLNAAADFALSSISFSVFKYHPLSDYTKAVGPLKVFEVPMPITLTSPAQPLDVVGVPQIPSEFETGTPIKMVQQATSDVPTPSTPTAVLPTSQLSIQFSAALQGPRRTAQVSYYLVDRTTSTLVTQQTTSQGITTAPILTSIPVDKLGDLTSDSVIVAMIHYINNEDSNSPIQTYFFTKPFTVQSGCGDGENVCKNDGVCGLDGACHCAHNNWEGKFCDESTHCVEPSKTQCFHGGQLTKLTNDVPPQCDLTQPCECVDDWKGTNCACALECQHDGLCQPDGTCQCAGNNWDGDLCASCSLECQNGGSFNAECTECVCVDGWRSVDCATCPLQCQNDGSANTTCTECVCADNNWDGAFCDECSLQCQNGGSAKADCTECVCGDNNWDGEFCDQCSLSCANGGIPNTACTECICVGSWGGNFCYTCPLKCYNDGFHNTECTKCDCFTGFTGDSCEHVASNQVDDVNNVISANFMFALSMVAVYSSLLLFH